MNTGREYTIYNTNKENKQRLRQSKYILVKALYNTHIFRIY